MQINANGRITNKECQAIDRASERTAFLELSELVKANLLEHGVLLELIAFINLKRQKNSNEQMSQ